MALRWASLLILMSAGVAHAHPAAIPHAHPHPDLLTVALAVAAGVAGSAAVIMLRNRAAARQRVSQEKKR